MLAAAVHPDADVDPGDREEGAEQREPDHHLAPQRAVLPERGEIEPVRYGAEPVPETLGAVGVLHDLATEARDVELGAAIVGQRGLVERCVAALLQRPLVDLDRRDLHRGSGAEGIAHVRQRDAAGLGPGDCRCRGAIEAGQDGAVGSDRAQHRMAEKHLDRGTFDRSVGRGDRGAAARDVERVEPGHALGGGRLGIRDVEHDEAR